MGILFRNLVCIKGEKPTIGFEEDQGREGTPKNRGTVVKLIGLRGGEVGK